MPLSPGFIADRFLRGIEYVDKPIAFSNSFIVPGFVAPPGVFIFDDFAEDTINLDRWADSEEGVGTAFAISTTAGDPVAGHGGWISGATAATAGNNREFAGELIWRADRAGSNLLVFEARITLPSVALIAVNAGFNDAKSEVGITVDITGANVLTTAGSDVAVIAFDTDQTTDEWIGVNVDTDVDGAVVTGGGTPAANTAKRLRVEIASDGGCYYHTDGVFRGSELATGVTETVLLAPYLGVETRTTAAKTLEVDYIFVGCAR